MKAIYSNRLLDQINAALDKAEDEGKIIEHIEVTKEEITKLRIEIKMPPEFGILLGMGYIDESILHMSLETLVGVKLRVIEPFEFKKAV